MESFFLSLGRNFEYIYSVLIALQTADAFGHCHPCRLEPRRWCNSVYHRGLLSEERMIPTDELDYKYFFYHSDNKSININHYGLEVHSVEQKNEILFSE